MVLSLKGHPVSTMHKFATDGSSKLREGIEARGGPHKTWEVGV